MCSKEDFLNWSEIDLDAVLIDYTDDDFSTTGGTESSDSRRD